VLDISRFIAGPFAGQLLGHLGADVVKVEEPGRGDPMRGLSKYGDEGMSAHFLAGNASKRSIELDLKSDSGHDTLCRLLEKADVLIENFRPGVMDKLKLSHAWLQERYPRLIIASVTGFGQSGPWRHDAAYDLIAQAAGGGMSLTGRSGEAPVKMGLPIGDVGASLYAVIGVLAALNRRRETGRGDVVDIGMMDVQLSLLNYHAHYYWISGEEPQPEGDSHPNIAPYQTFSASDRPFVVAVYGDPFWPGFCRAAGCVELEDDPRFSTNARRREHVDALVDILASIFAKKSRAHWLDRLREEGVPAAPLHSVGEALNSEQAQARNMSVLAEAPDGATVRVLGSPLKFASARTRITPPPVLGADMAVVMRAWGVTGTSGQTPRAVAGEQLKGSDA